MSAGTMEGELAVAVMEEKPSPLLGCLFLDSGASHTGVAEESARASRFYSLLHRFVSSDDVAYWRDWTTEPIEYDPAELNSDEVKFSVITPSKGGFDIKIRSRFDRMHVPKYASAHHPLVPMMFFARNLFDGTFACAKSIVPRRVHNMMWRSGSVVSRSVGIATETRVESVGVYAESGLGCTAIPSAISPAIAAKENEDATYHDNDVDIIARWRALAASLLEQKKIINFLMNGWDNYTGYMDGVREVTHTKPEHHSVMEAAEKKTAATWVVATAATHHVTGNRDLLSGFTPDQPGRFVESADGAAPMPVLGHGSVITDTVVLPDVLYVPGGTSNLISVGQLAELDYTIRFSRRACYIRSAADGTIVGKASVGEDGLFELDFLKVVGAIGSRPVI